ncbi:MAG: nickel pincer cofactor biosynthesis protein LarC [Acidobacteriota bacterium]
MIAYLDPAFGIAGDMTVAALVDAGADGRAVNDALRSISVPGGGLGFRFRTVRRAGLKATLAEPSLPEEDHPRHLPEIRRLVEASSLAPPARERALKVFELLAEAEAKVHGVAPEEVHFHEVGALDALCDVVGALAAWEDLGMPEVVSGPLNLGSGFTTMAHGTFPVPPPAVVELTRGLPVFSFGPPLERTTPTGAALARVLSSRFGPMPSGTLKAAGLGAGTHDSPGVPNVLRLLLLAEGPQEGLVSVLEAQIDDMTPELLAGAVEQLRSGGALDVTLTAVQAKKGRGAWLLTLLCPPAEEERMARRILETTTTTGVRLSRWERREAPREVVAVETPWGVIRCKRITLPSGRTRLHPEWEDLEAAARRAGRPALEVAEGLSRFLP